VEREEVVVVAAPMVPSGFDPLVELRGLWTTELAERYLPIEGLPPAKYECLDGNLIMSPREGSGNSWAASRLTVLMDQPVLKAGFFPYLSLNVLFGNQRWIEPDLTILRQPVMQTTWVPAEPVLMPIEFVSRSSVRRDRIDKPALCAAAGIPYFMRIEISRREAHVELLRLDDSGEYVFQAKALAGQEFRTDLPFPLSFDPEVLLES
jgi:Uma2 family endonuclease